MIVEEFLEHYGVKGMHWGVRDGKRTGTSSDYRKVSDIRRKKTRQLTNQQLKTHNERANLEVNFRRLNPSKVDKGRRAAKGILGTAVAGASVYNLVNSPAGKATVEAGKRFIKRKT